MSKKSIMIILILKSKAFKVFDRLKNSPVGRVFIENTGVARFSIMCYTVFGSEAELTTTREVCYE